MSGNRLGTPTTSHTEWVCKGLDTQPPHAATAYWVNMSGRDEDNCPGVMAHWDGGLWGAAHSSEVPGGPRTAPGAAATVHPQRAAWV